MTFESFHHVETKVLSYTANFKVKAIEKATEIWKLQEDPEPPADPQIEALVRQLELENEDATLSFETRPRYPAGFAKRNVIVTNFFSN
ncbi:hypothetical protein TNCV_3720611 [Trichonephila clavipes]|nr:hypothetical protein TNCV_3720611 [Trichonephila clavipes]